MDGGVSLVRQIAEHLSSSNLPFIAHHNEAISLTLVSGIIAFVSLILGDKLAKISHRQDLCRQAPINQRFFDWRFETAVLHAAIEHWRTNGRVRTAIVKVCKVVLVCIEDGLHLCGE